MTHQSNSDTEELHKETNGRQASDNKEEFLTARKFFEFRLLCQ